MGNRLIEMGLRGMGSSSVGMGLGLIGMGSSFMGMSLNLIDWEEALWGWG